MVMSEDRYDLDDIIKNSFEETIDYLKKNNIRIGGLSLITFESLEEFQRIYKINKKFKFATYDSEKREIYIIKNGLKKVINSNINNPNRIFIGNLFTITQNGILYPVYKNNDNIEKIIAKASVKPIVIHEIGHHIVGHGEWKASVFESLVYFYQNEFHRYPEVYEIMKKNIEICDEYIKKKDPSSPYSLGSPLAPYSLGSCFANDIIYVYENALNRNNELPRLNIKDIIEKLKHFSKDYYVEIIKTFNMILIDYITIAKTLNAKYAMLSWIANCLLEKPPNMADNI
jgi:hypothetical protein